MKTFCSMFVNNKVFGGVHVEYLLGCILYAIHTCGEPTDSFFQPMEFSVGIIILQITDLYFAYYRFLFGKSFTDFSFANYRFLFHKSY